MQAIHTEKKRKDYLVSVVVPIYQVERYLDKCISSIIKQTYDNLEIILVDDGSTDSCPAICDKYKDLDKRVKVIHQKNGGLVNARKTGINCATGEYLVYIDGDDWISCDYIEGFISHLQDDSYDILWSLASYREYEGDAKLCGYLGLSNSELESVTVQENLYKKVSGEFGFQNAISYTLCMKCFKLSFLKIIQNSLDDRISYDEDFCCIIRGLALGAKVRFIRNDGYYYVQRNDSINHEQSLQDKNLIMLDDTITFLQSVTHNSEKLMNLVKKQYQISQVYHGCIERIQDEKCDEIIPFRNAKKNKKIILYGMGTTGKSLLNFFMKSKVVEVVGYFDAMCQSDVSIVPFINICDIHNIDYDYVLVSVIKEYFVDEIRNNLINIGVEQDRIAIIDLS